MTVLRRSLTLVSALSAAFLGTTFVGTAGANHVGCGDIIVANTVLDSNIGPCGAGLTIGADNITLDLAGRTISGAVASGQGAGVLLDGRTGVTVKNGTITGFDAGVAIDGGSNNRVLNMSLTDNVGSFQTDFGDGVAVFGPSTGNLIQGNQIYRNGPFSGISLVAANGNTIDSNKIVNNNLNNNNTAGIRVENIGNTGSNFNVITNNQVVGSATFGIQLFSRVTDNLVRNNQVIGNRLDGIPAFAGAQRNVIESNQVRSNGGDGIALRGPAGVVAIGAINNQVLRNYSFGNGGFDLRDFNPNCDNNLWRGNQGGTGTPPCVFTP